MAKTKYDEIKEELHSLNSKLAENNEETKKIRVVVTGNGSKGHEQRLEKLEEWTISRPKECPVQIKKKNILARRAVDAAIIGLVLTVVLWILQKVF